MDNKDLPEAPASVTYTILTKSGFNCLFTLRETSGETLLTKMTGVEKKFAELGIVPQPARSSGFPKKEIVYVEGKKCPKCGGRLIEKTKKDGGKYHACENGKYDYLTKTKSGCDYIDWLNPAVPSYNKAHPYEGETIPVEEYEKDVPF